MQWQLQDADLRRTWGVDPDLRPWTCVPDVRLQGFGIPDTTRARALMDLAAIDHLGPKCAAGLVQESQAVRLLEQDQAGLGRCLRGFVAKSISQALDKQ